MKTRFSTALSMLAAAALGGAAIQALHAQAKPPVYMIAINEVTDQEGYSKEYVPPAQKSVKDHGGEYRWKAGAILPNFRPYSRLARNTRNSTLSPSTASNTCASNSCA
jgi:hypothetical protein